MHTLFFSLTAIPDAAAGRLLYGKPKEMALLDDGDVARVMLLAHNRHTDVQENELPLHLQRLAAISCVSLQEQKTKVLSFNETQSGEAGLIEGFFDLLRHHKPELMSWDKAGAALSLLQYRALLHGISLPRYWKHCRKQQRDRRVSLLDRLSLQRADTPASLDEIACLCGFSNRPDETVQETRQTYLRGDIAGVQRANEEKALKTCLVFLRFQLIQGELDTKRYVKKCAAVMKLLKKRE